MYTKKYNKRLVPNARVLRQNMTKEERHLWYDYLRTLPHKFVRQKVFEKYIADFYCASANLVIELDGSQHFEDSGYKSDQYRTSYMENCGVRVVRIPNNEVNSNFIGVCDYIDSLLECSKTQPSSAAITSSIKNGEHIMKKSERLQALKEQITEKERTLLQEESKLSINAFNRKTMLELLADTTAYSGEVADGAAEHLKEINDAYLAKFFADKPDAWKWIYIACVYLSLVKGMPMHPQESVNYTTEIIDGETVYFCKYKNDDPNTHCGLCVCKKLIETADPA